MQANDILRDRYQLQRPLGRAPGRQACWLAHDLSTTPPQPVVVKLLAFNEMQWDDLKLFEREAQVLQQLQHPQIPRYRDAFTIGEPPNWFGLVQDYIPGKSLKQWLDAGKRLSEKQIRQIAINLLHLLRYLHELNPPILHRDIKPSNLIWGEDNFIYLVDFDAAQNRAARDGATFTVVGTYGYAPLEQFGGRAVPASDLYGLGATLIHLLTGISPADLPQHNLRLQFRDRVQLSPTFASWLERLVEPDVAQRWPSAQTALAALQSPPPTTFPPATLPAAAPRSLAPPVNTRVEVTRSPQELLLQIPGGPDWPSPLVLTVIIASLIVGRYVVVSLLQLLGTPTLLLPLLVPLLVVGVALYWDSRPTVVHFQGDRFTIYKQVGQTTINLGQGAIPHIANVFHTLKTIGHGKNRYERRVVVIQTGFSEEVFGINLSWEECAWLVDVIQAWLAQRSRWHQ